MPQLTDTLLMVRPARFQRNRETAVNNYFQKEIDGLTAKKLQDMARQEFDEFAAKLRRAGIRVVVVEDTIEPATPDSIFPNNWVSFHAGGQHVLYPMYAPNRRQERAKGVLNSLSKELKLRLNQPIDLTHFEQNQVYLEGTGSIVLDRENRLAYAAKSERMHSKALAKFCQLLEYTVVEFSAFHTVNGQRLPVYHTNVLLSVGRDVAVICPSAIDNTEERDKVLSAIKGTGKELIEISEAQMGQFAGNILQVLNQNNESIMAMSAAAYGAFTAGQRQALGRHATLVYSNLSTIETLGGGSARCMLAEVFR